MGWREWRYCPSYNTQTRETVYVEGGGWVATATRGLLGGGIGGGGGGWGGGGGGLSLTQWLEEQFLFFIFRNILFIQLHVKLCKFQTRCADEKNK